ncbi:MAG: Holliday junction resolvase [Candidatus Thermoplasmatota archaeon]|nr:Holliday junction resolvase [Euryarchaeota archaeon]MAM99607.1 Holliday junction resolvase [Euryarchaeota archaeon]MBS64811.1 Holliday junction resolvase [Euryarchaeota archaeon]MED5451790.1 Holliday junction resolvase [Candidatus Thermoplasmatota archaeon]
MSSVYERELRAVLAGEIKGVRAIIKSCTEVERARAMQVVQRPFLVVRAPGSGSEGTGDLLALRGDMCFPIEVKSSKVPKQYLSGRTMDQYEALRVTGERCGLLPLYAYRLKGVRGDSWRIMRVEVGSLTGKLRHLSRSIPKLPLTKNGTPHLDWEKGMPLHRFLALVCRSDGARSIDESSASLRLQSILESVN